MGDNRGNIFGARTTSVDPDQNDSTKVDSDVVVDDANEMAKDLTEVPEALNTAVESADASKNQGKVMYSSHPIQRFRVGRYQFEKGMLELDAEEAERFDELLEKSSIRTQATVKKIDAALGEVVARRLIAQFRGGTMRRGIDSSSGGNAGTTN